MRSTTAQWRFLDAGFAIIDADVNNERGAPYETSDARLRVQGGVFPR